MHIGDNLHSNNGKYRRGDLLHSSTTDAAVVQHFVHIFLSAGSFYKLRFVVVAWKVCRSTTPVVNSSP